MEIIRKHLEFNQEEKFTNFLPFSISYHHNPSYSSKSLEFTGPKLGIKFLFTCSFTFCWIRIRNYNSGSESRQKIHNTGFFYIVPVPALNNSCMYLIINHFILSDDGFSRALAFQFLESVQSKFCRKFGGRAQTALPYSLNTEFRSD